MEFKEFNETDCLAFIRSRLPENVSAKYDDDAILYVVDFIWDYYDRKGMLSLNDIDFEDELLDREDLENHCREAMRSVEEYTMDDTDLQQIVKAELDYEDSLEAF